jgi:hypothetical protein
MNKAEQVFEKMAGPADFFARMYAKALVGTKSLGKETAALKRNTMALIGGERARMAANKASKVPQMDLFKPKPWTPENNAMLKVLRKKVGKGMILPGVGIAGVSGVGYTAGKSRD